MHGSTARLSPAFRAKIGAALLAFTALLALTGCLRPGAYEETKPAGTDRFTIQTPSQTIQVEGSLEAMEGNAAEIIMRLESVDPAMIRPGIALWAAPRGGDPVLIGRVVDVQTRGAAL